MSKPIFIVKIPIGSSPQECDGIGYHLSRKLNDYHVAVVRCNNEGVTFECYNTTDLDTKSFEELKELVKTYKTE